MSQQYDTLSDRYDQSKALPVGRAEQSTLLAALPDLSGASVLDVGCGSGFYSRLFARRGASRVHGVDASAPMIAQARDIERRENLGISYDVCDAGALPVLGAFDVVTAIWLVGYAETTERLGRMLGTLHANLTEGGTLVVLAPNPDFDWHAVTSYPRYGLTISPTTVTAGDGNSGDGQGLAERQGSIVRFHTDPPFEVEGLSWPPGVVEAAIVDAGLTDPHRHPVTVPTDTPTPGTADFWTDLVANPTFAVFTATRR